MYRLSSLRVPNQVSPRGSTWEISHIVSSVILFLPIQFREGVCVAHRWNQASFSAASLEARSVSSPHGELSPALLGFKSSKISDQGSHASVFCFCFSLMGIFQGQLHGGHSTSGLSFYFWSSVQVGGEDSSTEQGKLCEWIFCGHVIFVVSQLQRSLRPNGLFSVA